MIIRFSKMFIFKREFQRASIKKITQACDIVIFNCILSILIYNIAWQQLNYELLMTKIIEDFCFN